jgi:hypothetical protein
MLPCGYSIGPAGGQKAMSKCRSGESRLCIICPQTKAVFGSRSEHSIGFGNPLQNQIIDHYTDIAFPAFEDEWCPARSP